MSIKNYEKLSNGNLQKRYEFLTKEESTNFYTTSGTGTEYTVSVPYINELSDGVSIKIKFHTDSSANCYLNINSLGKRRLMIDTSTVATTEFKAGSYCTLIYNSSISSSIAQNPSSATGGWVLQYANGNVIGSTMGYEELGDSVTISFTNMSPSNYTNHWWKVYKNYTITNNNIYFLSSDELTTHASNDTSPETVTTNTGKLFILCRGNQADATYSYGTINCSSGITCLGAYSGGNRMGELNPGDLYLEGSRYPDDVPGMNLENWGVLLYSFTVTADGTITIDGSIWAD